jgi:2-oxoglutarate ferredoxin oxidoreductase subunit beta
VHDETDRAMAGLLAALQPPLMPVALGVLFCDPTPSYESSVVGEVDAAKRAHPAGLAELLHKGHTWTVS